MFDTANKGLVSRRILLVGFLLVGPLRKGCATAILVKGDRVGLYEKDGQIIYVREKDIVELNRERNKRLWIQSQNLIRAARQRRTVLIPQVLHDNDQVSEGWKGAAIIERFRKAGRLLRLFHFSLRIGRLRIEIIRAAANNES